MNVVAHPYFWRFAFLGLVALVLIGAMLSLWFGLFVGSECGEVGYYIKERTWYGTCE